MVLPSSIGFLMDSPSFYRVPHSNYSGRVLNPFKFGVLTSISSFYLHNLIQSISPFDGYFSLLGCAF